MEDEIDLGVYLDVIARRWHWLLGFVASASLGTFLLCALVLERQYEAEALILVTKPRYIMRFDPRFETLTDLQPPSRALPTLAESDVVLQKLLHAAEEEAGSRETTMRELRRKLSARMGADPSLIELRVLSPDPEHSASLANQWADVFVRRANALYGGSALEAEHLAEQLDKAGLELKAAEEALVTFQSRDARDVLKAELSSTKISQSRFLAELRSIEAITEDAAALVGKVKSRLSEDAVTLADEVTALLLQIKAFNVQTAPIQLQLEGLSRQQKMSGSDLAALLDDLTSNLEMKKAAIEERLRSVTPNVLNLQAQIQELEVENQRILNAREIAEETFLTLARKLEESQIASNEREGDVRIASQASVPESPARPRTLLYTAAAFAASSVLGVFLIFASYYRRARVQSQHSARGHELRV